MYIASLCAKWQKLNFISYTTYHILVLCLFNFNRLTKRWNVAIMLAGLHSFLQLMNDVGISWKIPKDGWISNGQWNELFLGIRFQVKLVHKITNRVARSTRLSRSFYLSSSVVWRGNSVSWHGGIELRPKYRTSLTVWILNICTREGRFYVKRAQEASYVMCLLRSTYLKMEWVKLCLNLVLLLEVCPQAQEFRLLHFNFSKW